MIIKNQSGKRVPDRTLQEAGVNCVCRSKAWSKGVIISAYWVYDHQVSKTAPSGLSLGHGSFMIYGKKNFLYPSKLEMGWGLLFKLDPGSLEAHALER